MKRAIAVFLILAMLSPVLLLPASAAESDQYYFEKNMVSFYGSFVMPFMDGAFITEEIVPDGVYNLDVFFADDLGFVIDDFHMEPITVNYVPTDFDEATLLASISDTVFSYSYANEAFTAPCTVTLILLADMGTVALISGDIFIPFSESHTSCFYFDDVSDAILLTAQSLDSVSDILPYFLGQVMHTFVDFSVSNLVIIILASLGLCCSPVILWFGYRFVKKKVVSAFKKGKI